MRVLVTLILLVNFYFSFSQERLSLVVPIGHTRPVQEIAVSQDSLWLASVDFDPGIILWDYQKKIQLLTLEGHSERVTFLEFLEENILVSGGKDGKVILWDPAEAGIVQSFDHSSEIIGAKINDSLVITATKNGTITFWDRKSGDKLDSLKTISDEVTAFSSSKDLLLGDKKGRVSRYDTPSGKLLDSISVFETSITTINQTGDYLVTGNNQGEVVFLNDQFEELKVEQLMDYRVYDLALDPKGKLLYVSGRGKDEHIKTYDLNKYKPKVSSFDLGNTPESQIALGIRNILLFNNSLIYGTPGGTIVQKNLTDGSYEYFSGEAAPLTSIFVSGEQLYLANSNYPLKKIDLSGIQPLKSFENAGENVNSVASDALGSIVVTANDDGKLTVSDPDSEEIISLINAKSRYTSTPVKVDPSGSLILRKNQREHLDIYRYRTNKKEKLKVEGFNYQFSNDGRTFYAQSEEGIEIFEIPGFKKSMEITNSIQDFDRASGRIVILEEDHQTLSVFTTRGDKLSSFMLDSIHIDKVRIHPGGKIALGYSISIKNDGKRDFSVYIISLDSGKVLGTLDGHSGFIREIKFFKQGDFIFTASADGRVNIYKNGEYGDPEGSIISLGKSDFVVVTPEGFYDATPRAMKSLHYTRGGDILALDQFKQSFFEPNLLPRILGIIEEPLPDKNIRDVKLHPEINIKHPNLNNGSLGISLSDKGGGIGNVMIIINGKEVARDARAVSNINNGSLEFDYQVSNHPYLKENELNRITIKAFNSDGSLSSDEKNIFVFPDKKQQGDHTPRLYAVIAGSSDYQGEQLDLKFAAKDAEDFAKTLSISAANHFGEENVNISLLTTNQEDKSAWPYKKNIDSVFTQFSKEAVASDYLLIYLSGHGVNEKDFYYLTPEASNQNVDSMAASYTISSSELTEMIKRVAALQQVLIIDACHSGRFANELMQLSGASAMGSEQVKALEKMKDRTGMYVLAGSKADAVSYEADLFEQGLLTYSILFGMKGAALRSGNSIDVIDLFQFVNEKVPQLAEEIGGVQKPELRYPNNANSFVIGQLNEEDKANIRIVESKPVFLFSSFQEEESISDPVGLSGAVNQALRSYSNDSSEIVFIEKESFAGGYSIWGRYSITDELITVQVNLLKDQKLISSFEKTGLNPQMLSDEIVKEAVNFILYK